MSRDNDMFFQRGQTAYGPDQTIDTNDLQFANILGAEKVFEDIDLSQSGAVKPSRTERLVTVRAVRNTSGVTVYAKHLALLNAAGTEITGRTNTTSAPLAYPIDEYLTANGCRHGDVCYVVVEGPAMCQTGPGNMAADINAKDPLHSMTSSGATTAAGSTAAVGRVIGFTAVSASDLTNTNAVRNFAQNFLGYAISSAVTDDVDTDILVNIRKRG